MHSIDLRSIVLLLNISLPHLPQIFQKELKASTLEQAKEEGQKAAAKLKKEMLAEAPKAGAAASKPYMDALGRAAATAGDFTKAGDANVGASTALQMQAGRRDRREFCFFFNIGKGMQILEGLLCPDPISES